LRLGSGACRATPSAPWRRGCPCTRDAHPCAQSPRRTRARRGPRTIRARRRSACALRRACEVRGRCMRLRCPQRRRRAFGRAQRRTRVRVMTAHAAERACARRVRAYRSPARLSIVNARAADVVDASAAPRHRSHPEDPRARVR
jgi:hypothetical protein